MKLLIAILFLLAAFPGLSQTDAFRTKQFNLDNGVAIKGYDPVSYFLQKKAEKGNKENSISYHRVTYYFASASDQQAFEADPVKYEPQYGGWCAYAMGHDGSTVQVDPETFKIINGKLFLFYNRFFNNTLKTWNQNESGLHSQADANWQKILSK
jgi:YHS domain-containing protein